MDFKLSKNMSSETVEYGRPVMLLSGLLKYDPWKTWQVVSEILFKDWK